MASLSRLRVTQTASAAAALFAAGLFSIASHVSSAHAAEDAIYAPGDPIVTGFSGVVPPDSPPPAGDPLDHTFIDLDGPSMVIHGLEPGGPPSGRLIPSASLFTATAGDVGQVFGVTLDNAHQLTGAAAPDIYLSATSAFGLNIVVPGADGNPVRSRVGAPGATFMAGQWGSAGGAEGYPGSIWKVDGETGEISLFSTIAANTGAGLGDIVHDPASAQFFVSDLDTGLIYRLAADGIIIDTFDHGVSGRPEHGLDAVEDDGSAMDVTDPAFDSEDPATWGFSQAERKVYGLAVHGGRLYYAVADGPQIWSVRIAADGSFGAARWELDVTGPLSSNEVTDIAFDPQGRMILAQRGPQVGSYDYSIFAEPGISSIVRYEREFPDDLATPGTWVETPDSYAVGFAPDGGNASGGIALGPKYDDETGAFDGACDAYLWATGDSLRDDLSVDSPLDPPAQIHGLQGNSHSLVKPENEPPTASFFVDFDGNTDNDQAIAQGHVGGVAFWQECEFDAETYVPPVLPPDDFEPGGDLDEEEEEDEEENLTLEKWSSPFFCFDGGANWHCNFTIRVENTGDEPYWGPIVIDDYLPDNNPGATMSFWPQPPWHCSPTGPTAYQCVRGPVLLYPGDGVVLHEVVTLPKAMVGYCELVNVAGLNWFWDGDDDPSDDFNVGVAGIKAPGCVPPGGGNDLSLNKETFPTTCVDNGADWRCTYVVLVQNAGPDNFSGPITVTDTLGINSPATTFGPWVCAQAGPVLTCNIIAPPVNVPPGWTSGFLVSQTVPKPAAPAVCELTNRAVISTPAGGTPTNFNAGNDSDDATTTIPEPVCLLLGDSDIQVQKTGLGCSVFFTGYACEWQVTVTNVGAGPYAGPFSMKDVSIGAVVNTLPTLYPGFCAGSPAQVTCSDPFVILPAGAGGTFTFHTLYAGGPAVCSANNNISILAPNPGSPQNPAGNDSASVGQALPNPACPPALLPRLNIQKTATGCAADPASPDWLCTFDITVLNYGGGPQPAPIQVKDFNDKPTTFAGAACAPSGVNQYLCTRPVPLNAGSDWTFQATTRVNPNSVTLADCHVINTVWISSPPSGGDPGYFSQADQKVPQLFINVGPGPVAVYCDPPSLKLTKTAVKTVKSGDGYDATFTVRATSTGPDPYIGTVEVDDVLPDGTSFVSSTNWSCVPTTGNDVHCSSAFKTIPVGKYTEMTITIHIPADVAVASRCSVVNTVNAAISAEVLHSEEGVQYTASAEAELPASLCRPPAQCPVARVMPGGGCCEEGTQWNGKQCAKPRPRCPADSHLTQAGKCVCDEGTSGEPGKCEPIQSKPICPDDSRLVRGECRCLPGTEGRSGRCKPIEEEVEELTCPKDSRLLDGECVCRKGTEGPPGRCKPIEEEVEEVICPKDSRLVDGECVCRKGTEGPPGRCRPIEEEVEEEVIETPSCPDDSHFDTRRKSCVCNRPLVGEPGQCTQPFLELETDRPMLKLPTFN